MQRDCPTSREVSWQHSLHSIRNPASNSRPPISRRQSSFRFHICNRLHCPAQSKFVLTSRPLQTRLRAAELRRQRFGTWQGGRARRGRASENRTPRKDRDHRLTIHCWNRLRASEHSENRRSRAMNGPAERLSAPTLKHLVPSSDGRIVMDSGS